MATTVRFATKNDVEALESLTAKIFAGLDLDWSTTEPQGWLVAEVDGEVLGAVQVYPMIPVGCIEHLVVNESLSPRKRFNIVAHLFRKTYDVMTTAGVQVSTSFVDFQCKTAKKLLKKYLGGVVVCSGNMILVRK